MINWYLSAVRTVARLLLRVIENPNAFVCPDKTSWCKLLVTISLVRIVSQIASVNASVHGVLVCHTMILINLLVLHLRPWLYIHVRIWLVYTLVILCPLHALRRGRTWLSVNSGLVAQFRHVIAETLMWVRLSLRRE